ncbi:MAG TPA: hypothetical protein PKC30_12135 [Saprospiraceae bacterium]|nr:hypothetical protein [Saprospiraceae bacterium]
MKGLYFLVSTLYILTGIGCIDDDFEIHGMTPVYLSYDDFSEIKTLPPRPFGELGKLVVYRSFIFINEINKGIHVIDNANPSFPEVLFFWNIPGNREFIISENTLYADNGLHLLVIDITQSELIRYVTHVANQYIPEHLDAYPDDHDGWFECYDRIKGILVGWEEKLIINPNCKML